MRPPHKSSSRAAKSAPQKQLDADASDPLFNQTVQKALSILEVFGSEKTALNLTEIGVAVGMTKSSAQRCTHTLERLGYLRRDPRVKRWVLTPQALNMAHSYLSGHPLIEQATTHLIDLNQASGESVSLSEPYETDMVFIARFPSHKRFFIHMPVGRRLPMFCTASGRAYLSGLPTAEVQKLLVHPAARRRGLARALMLRAQQEAARAGRNLLTLDTRAGDAAENLYRAMGWQEAGRIPGYALNADLTPCLAAG